MEKVGITAKQVLTDLKAKVINLPESKERLCRELSDDEYIKEVMRKIPLKFWDIDTDRDVDLLWMKSLFIYGQIGRGKTCMACSLAKRYIRQNYMVWFVSYPGLCKSVRQAHDDRCEKSAYDIVDDVAHYKGMLIIDDLGAEKTTDFIREMTYYILNEREMKMRKTIITSNYNLEEIDTQIDPRISSRIAGMCEVIELTGKDQRIEKQNQDF